MTVSLPSPRLGPLPRCLAVALVLMSSGGIAAGQDRAWTVALTLGASTVAGSSRDTAGGAAAFGPHAPATVSVALRRRLGRWGGGLMVSYGRADLALDGTDLLLVDHTTHFTSLEFAPVAEYRLTRLGNDAALLLLGGPVLSLWRLTDSPDRTRIGALLGAALPVWFGERVGGVVRLEGIAMPSAFEKGELPAPFERTATLMVRLSIGVVAGF